MGVLLGHHHKVVRRFTSISSERYYSEACLSPWVVPILNCIRLVPILSKMAIITKNRKFLDVTKQHYLKSKTAQILTVRPV